MASVKNRPSSSTYFGAISCSYFIYGIFRSFLSGIRIRKSRAKIRRIQSLNRWKKLLSSLLSSFPRGHDMGDGVLVRNVPEEVRLWIHRQRQRHQMSQQEVILSALHRASLSDLAPLLPFEGPSKGNHRPRDTTPSSLSTCSPASEDFRTALDKLGGECVFSSEWDRYSQKTYKAWYGETPKGDITKITVSEIPDHDFLAAGFPCQPFSIAGVSRRTALVRHMASSAQHKAHSSSTLLRSLS